MPPLKSDPVRLGTVSSLSGDDCRLLVESVVDYAIFMLDLEGRVLTWNPGAQHIKGYAASEIIGQHFSKFYPPEDINADKPQRELVIAAETGRVEDEGWRVRKGGSRFWASVVITALRDDTGKLRGFGKVTRDLTERRRVEEALRGSEERFRLLLENVADYAIYMLDLGGTVSTWNLGAERMKGYLAREIIGKNFAAFFPEEDVLADKPARELAAARAHGRHEDEGWRVRKDGTRFWANAVLTALHDATGQLIGYAKITRDLTLRREADENQRRLIEEQAARDAAERAGQQLRESEERYRALSQRLEIVLEGVADGITVQDRSGRVVFANSAAARICGFDTGEELINTPPEQIVARFEMLDQRGQPFDVAELPGRRVLAGEKMASALVRVRQRSTRRDWWALIRASAVQALDGSHELAINIWHDVTDQHRQDRQSKYIADVTSALTASLNIEEMSSMLARALVPGLGDWCAIHLLGEDRELRNVAVAHVDPAKLALARDYQRKFAPDPSRPQGAANVLRTGKTEVYNDISDEMLVRSASSPEQLALLRSVGMQAVVLVPIAVRSRVLGVLSLVFAESDMRYEPADVALAEELGRRAGVALENAQLYAAAQAAATAAEEASRAKDEFLATVSHELRTPLSAILGWSSILKDKVTDASLVKPLSVIHRNAEAQVKIIDDILDVSRVITGKFRLDPKPADLVAIGRDALEVVRASAAAKKISIDFLPSADYLLIVADAERLQQVIWNLLSNALKFTANGGRIWLTVAQESSSVVIAVQDTGQGIDPGFLPYVFDRFKQADSSISRRVGGLGLGLALVRHIVEAHGGRVTASSPGLGKGSLFTVTLPIRAVFPAAAGASPAPPINATLASPSSDLSGVRVLVVDDEADARELVATVLRAAGAVVETARSAAEGFELFKLFRPQVLVSDIGMPEEDGFAFIRRIRALPLAEGGRVPSLALTAFAREEDRTRALSSGYTTHIGKPVDPSALTSAVANLSTVLRPS